MHSLESSTGMSIYRRWGKPAFDIFSALLGLIVLSPLLIAIAILIAWKLQRPVLFRQLRPGLAGKSFTLFKFRTMVDLYDDKGELLSDAERLTPFGSFLRATSLDELPELLNVLKGEMSLVGPRPLLVRYLERYTPEEMRRHDVKPGITGWAQVNGRNAITWDQKFQQDLWYVDHQSFVLDLKIIGLTLLKVFQREGISQAGHATMEEFRR
jgi:sugar transferase EpsL